MVRRGDAAAGALTTADKAGCDQREPRGGRWGSWSPRPCRVNAFAFVRGVSSDRVWAAQVRCVVRLGVAWAVEAGATIADHQSQQGVRVMLDPAGHPFCLFCDQV